MKNYLAITLLLSTLPAAAMNKERKEDFPPQIKIEKKDSVKQIRNRFESFNLGAGAAQEETSEFDLEDFLATTLATTVKSALEASGAFEDGAAIEQSKEEEARPATPFAAAVEEAKPATPFAAAIEEAGDVVAKPNSPLAQIIAENDEEAPASPLAASSSLAQAIIETV